MKCCPKEGQEHSRRAGTHPQHSPMAMPPAQPHPAPSCQCRRVLPPPKPCAPLELLFGRKGGFLELGLDICRAWIFPLKIPIPAAEQPLKHTLRGSSGKAMWFLKTGISGFHPHKNAQKHLYTITHLLYFLSPCQNKSLIYHLSFPYSKISRSFTVFFLHSKLNH